MRTLAEPPATVDHNRTTAQHPPAKYLLGIQGLRTVAALLVAIYHIWFHRVSGGVDVFFVVAGFFAAGSLYRSFGRATGFGDTLHRLSTYLLKTIRRIVPSAAIVVVGTVLLCRYFLPMRGQSEAVEPARAALGFWENWQLISASADYAQQGAGASPFQQFWALAINAQFYVLFSVVICVFVVATRAWRKPSSTLRTGMFAIAGVIAAASFAYSLFLTAENQPEAYFSTFTRLWEFMAGVFVFLLLKREFFRRSLAAALGWVGLALLIATGAFFDLSRLLPGYLSLIPVLAACAILVSAFHDAEPRVLKWKPVVAVADASFAFYLWHWPLLVVYRYRFSDDVSLLGGIAIIVVSLVLAVLTTRLIEDPVRKSRLLTKHWWATIIAAAAMLLAPLVLVNFWSSRIETQQQSFLAEVTVAEALISDRQQRFPDGPDRVGLLVPHPNVAYRDDSPLVYGPGVTCWLVEGANCQFGNADSPLSVVLVGGSHAIQWIEPVVEAAERGGASATLLGLGGCGFTDPVLDRDDWPWVADNCAEWNDRIFQEILEVQPTLVVAMGTTTQGGNERITPGMIERFQELSQHGISVLALRDNPRFKYRVPECVERRGLDACGVDRATAMRPFDELSLPAIAGVEFLDLADLYCAATTCQAVDGFVLQYKDNNHLTNTWVRQYGGPVRDRIVEKLAETSAAQTPDSLSAVRDR